MCSGQCRALEKLEDGKKQIDAEAHGGYEKAYTEIVAYEISNHWGFFCLPVVLVDLGCAFLFPEWQAECGWPKDQELRRVDVSG